MSRSLLIGLSAWIIQDGNYSEFVVGQRTRLALAFTPLAPVEITAATSTTLEAIAGSVYRVTGRVVFATHETWVCDFGILAYCESAPPPGVHTDVWVATSIYLGIDPYDYKDNMAGIPGMPQLFYDVEIERILQERSGSAQTKAAGAEWREVAATEANSRSGDSDAYLLQCQFEAPAA
jgi:hypothetical protein